MGRAYFACQALAGLLWWLAVFGSDVVRLTTLGHLPLELAYLDVPLFVLGSALAALGLRPATWVVLVWTVLVTVGMFAYATIAREAAWGLILMVAALGGTLVATARVQLGHVPTEWLVQGPLPSDPLPMQAATWGEPCANSSRSGSSSWESRFWSADGG